MTNFVIKSWNNNERLGGKTLLPIVKMGFFFCNMLEIDILVYTNNSHAFQYVYEIICDDPCLQVS